MTARGNRRRLAALSCAVALSAVTGCGDEGTASADGSDGDVPTSSTSASTSASPSPSTTPADPTPTVEPATGPQLDVEGIKVNAPKTWVQTYDTIVVDMAEDDDSGSVMLSAAGTGGDQLSLRQAEKYFWTRSRKPEGYEAQPTTVMGGLTAYHYVVRDRHGVTHAVGLWDAGYVVKVEVEMPERVAEEKTLAVLESVIASYESPRTEG
ncbi:hypothetical protein SAMN04489844_2427 [Nocardioides exalbidus]|uniref:Lipoprotein n=1 Tax=Nocardioides exalbidus TaxID=402596 RepID=A0A1H4T3C0_9ACTN|nr:hypothetical protein [Nocardioides exalbidus]SEC50922.1 hypothetical protein SAMN04489844_2427 [Nocardioides exalbidus]